MFKEIKNLLNNNLINERPDVPFNSLVCNFFDELSKYILKNKKAKKYSDLMTFAFWCRLSNLQSMQSKILSQDHRIGLGIIFHIAPSNVPINFAFSLAFGMLTGNSNIIKMSSKKFPQNDLLCSFIKTLFKKKKYLDLKNNNLIIQYESKNKKITSEISNLCDGRIIWGGDKTINEIKKISTMPHNRDITFSDKYSICLIKAKNIIKLKKNELIKLISNFYNDTYFIDQNACSSPHLICWLGSNNDIEIAQKKFWDNLLIFLKKKYLLEEIQSMDKYNKLHTDIIDYKKHLINFQNYENYIYVLNIKNFPKDVSKLRGKYGYFFQYKSNNIKYLKKIINSKFQTLTYFGLDKDEIVKFILDNRIKGVDRIIPIGNSLDIGFHWDGYDIEKILTRHINVQ